MCLSNQRQEGEGVADRERIQSQASLGPRGPRSQSQRQRQKQRQKQRQSQQNCAAGGALAPVIPLRWPLQNGVPHASELWIACTRQQQPKERRNLSGLQCQEDSERLQRKVWGAS